MRVGVAYSEPGSQFWVEIEVPDEATAKDAVQKSGVLDRFPHIDLASQKLGVFGKVVKPDVALRAGDRVEIYRPIIADPQTVKRRDIAGSDDAE